MSRQQRKGHVFLRRPKQVENPIISSSPFGAHPESVGLYGMRYIGPPVDDTYLEVLLTRCSKNKCLYIPLSLFPSCFIIVAVGQFIIPTDESFRYLYWVGELVFSLLFSIFPCICCTFHTAGCNGRYFIAVMTLLMLTYSILGLLKSLNVVSWAWIWIFTPFFAMPFALIIGLCCLDRLMFPEFLPAKSDSHI